MWGIENDRTKQVIWEMRTEYESCKCSYSQYVRHYHDLKKRGGVLFEVCIML